MDDLHLEYVHIKDLTLTGYQFGLLGATLVEQCVSLRNSTSSGTDILVTEAQIDLLDEIWTLILESSDRPVIDEEEA